MQPRFLWRRGAAFLIDLLLASIATFAILAPVKLAFPDEVRLSSAPFYLRQCEDLETAPAAVRDLAKDWPIEGRPLSRIEACRIWVLGIDNGRVIRLEAGDDGFSRFREVAVGEDGTPTDPLTPGAWLQWALLVFGGAAFLSAAGRTPGKRLLGLRVEGPVRSYGRMLAREAVRLLPVLVGVAASEWAARAVPSAAPTEAPSLALALLPNAAILALVLALWILPLLFWRGRMPHDRAAGTVVARG